MRGLRTRAGVLVLGLVGSGATLLALTATWVSSGAGALPSAALTGRQVAPTAFALGLASLAGVGALLLLGAGGRRVVGTLLVVLGAGTVGAVWAAVARPGAVNLAWAAMAGIGGLVVMAAGVLAVLGGPAWQSGPSRYSRSGRPADTDLWRALDEGRDPTVGD